jgi:hypothetical protein
MRATGHIPVEPTLTQPTHRVMKITCTTKSKLGELVSAIVLRRISRLLRDQTDTVMPGLESRPLNHRMLTIGSH